MKRGPQGAQLLFFYEVSIVVLIHFIAILLTPGIFLIKIVNTNNKNMYLIHFRSKNNIKMYFPQSWVFKVSKQYQTFIIHRNVVKQIAMTSAKTSQQQNISRCLKKLMKSKLKMLTCFVVVHTILSRMFFFF